MGNDIRCDDDNPWGDIILSDAANCNMSDSTVSLACVTPPTTPFPHTPPPFLSTPQFRPTPLSRPNSLLNRRKVVYRLPQISTPFPIVSDMRVRTPDTSSVQRYKGEFTTTKPEESVNGSDTTESEIRNRILASGDCEPTQIG